jgi:flagellar L-ring protein precursor FlgH
VKRALVLLALVLLGCGPHHIKPFTPKSRIYTPGKYAINQADAKPQEGSLFSEAGVGLLQDTRAVRAGDVVIIKIDEQAAATGDASTKLSKGSKRDVNIDAMLGLVPAIKKAHPDIDPAKLISLAAQADFNGDGATSRKGELQGNIAVRVRERMPNGDLFLEGTKVVMINHEEYHLYISGVARAADIAQDNSLASSKIADAQVEFTGRGDVDETTEKGWLAKILDTVNPF